MISDPNEVRSEHQSPVYKIVAVTRAVLFFISGTAILTLEYLKKSKTFGINISLGPYPVYVGIILIIYGLYRGYRVYQEYFQNKQ